MEVVEACSKRKTSSSTKTVACPCKTKYKRYVQPPRVKSFAPERLYKAPSKQFEDRTTYHLSYLNVDRGAARCARLQPIRPAHSLEKNTGKFFDETTNKLSYRPVWQIVKSEPILPKRRFLERTGAMETVTTVRHDYVAKHIKRPEMIIPCGNIRTSSAPFDDKTMAKLSYLSPGPIEPVISCKPILKYRPSSQAFPKETTQRLSYQPFVVVEKEFYPWMQKSTYKPTDIAMCGKTTYSESYMKNDVISVEKPFLPVATYVHPYDAKFVDKTVYKESYLPSGTERMIPIVPCGNISIPDARMSADTTNKLSYQRVWTERRKSFVPQTAIRLATAKMQSETTTRSEYVAKTILRPKLVVHSDNIHIVDVPLKGDTTTGLSYVKPDVIKPVCSYKPVVQYYRPEVKIDYETINKLSYQTWTPGPKEKLSWAQKSKYRAPENPMTSDTVYRKSYPVPGYYVEDNSCVECPCPADKQNLSVLTATS